MAIKKGDKVICPVPNMEGVWRVVKRQFVEGDGVGEHDGYVLTIRRGIVEECVAEDDCQLFRNPADLSHAELAGIVEGLLEMMYLNDEGEGEEWAPDQEVGGAALVDWVGYEMEKHSLIPPAGPRSATEEVV